MWSSVGREDALFLTTPFAAVSPVFLFSLFLEKLASMELENKTNKRIETAALLTEQSFFFFVICLNL